MATSKDIFAGRVFLPRVFAPGAFRGLGDIIVSVPPKGLDYSVTDNRPHYAVPDNRPFYSGKNP